MRQVIEKTKGILCEKANDNVPWKQLWKTIRRMNGGEELINISERIYKKTKI